MTARRQLANDLCRELLELQGKDWGEDIEFAACTDTEVEYVIESAASRIAAMPIAAQAKRNLGADAAYAVGRFRPDGPLGYKSRNMAEAPLRATRAEAVADEAAYWAKVDAAEEARR